MNGPLLAIDTSTSAGSVAVGDGARVLAEITLGVAGQHSTALMPAVDAAMRWAGVERGALRGVVVGGGPGSFTGLRIGAATAKGIVAALDLPLWSHSGLLAAAAGATTPAPGRGATVCAMFDARRRDVYAATYRLVHDGERIRIETEAEPRAQAIDEVLASHGGEERVVFAGDAALLHADQIRRLPGAVVAPAHLAHPRASALLWLVSVLPEEGRVDEPSTWEPEYLRAAGAERIAAERAGG